MDAILGAAYAPGSSLALGGGAGGGGIASSESGMGGMGGADEVSSARIAAFHTAQEVDGLLVAYGGALRELVGRVNAAHGRAGDDPLEVVRSILDAQMGALAYVDRQAGDLLGEARALDAALAMRGYGSGY